MLPKENRTYIQYKNNLADLNSLVSPLFYYIGFIYIGQGNMYFTYIDICDTIEKKEAFK